jgi:spore germination protein GerM
VRRIAVLLIALPFASCSKKPPAQNLELANKVAVRTVTLWYQGPQMLLTPETRDVALPESSAAALPVVVRELFNGSTRGFPPSYPRDTVVRGAFLLPDGTAFVDLGGATLTNGWGTGSHEELMAVYSVVQTVTTNFPEAKRVRILINGEPAETLAGHVGLGKALTPLGPMAAGH